MTTRPLTGGSRRRQPPDWALLVALRSLGALLAEPLPRAPMSEGDPDTDPSLLAGPSRSWGAPASAYSAPRTGPSSAYRQQGAPNPGLPGPLQRALRLARLAMQYDPRRTRLPRSGTGSSVLVASAARPLVSPVARRAEGSVPPSGSSRSFRATPRDAHASAPAVARSIGAAPTVPHRVPPVPPSPPPARPANPLQLVRIRRPSLPEDTTSPRLPTTAVGLPADRRSLLPDLVERSDIRVASVRADGLCPGSLHEARGPFSGSAECTDQ